MAAGKAATKSEVFQELAQKADVTKRQVAAIFEGLTELIQRELGKKGPGTFTIPGLLKLKRVNKPATKARQGVNPFTKEPMQIKAKPASVAVRARALKGLKESIK